MDYLTNYYKNLSEQLQEKINYLQNLLKEEEKKVYEDLPPPSISIPPKSIKEPGSRPDMISGKPFALSQEELQQKYKERIDNLLKSPKFQELSKQDRRSLMSDLMPSATPRSEINRNKYQDSEEWKKATEMPMTLPDGRPNMERVRAMERVRTTGDTPEQDTEMAFKGQKGADFDWLEKTLKKFGV